LGFGNWVVNNIYLKKELVYSVLPVYDVGSQVFAGVVVENRGRVTLTDVEVVFADLGVTIEAINMPGAHEPADVVAGGVGEEYARISIAVLTAGKSVPIYMLCSGEVELEEQRSLSVTSREVGGAGIAESTEREWMLVVYMSVGVSIVVVTTVVATNLWRRRVQENTDDMRLLIQAATALGRAEARQHQVERLLAERDSRDAEIDRQHGREDRSGGRGG
jgi:hypothetical protein